MDIFFEIDEFIKIDSFIEFVCKFSENTICTVETDSRKDLTRSLFVPIVGEHFDAHDFIPTAIENGATAICSSRKLNQQVLDLAEANNTTIFSVTDTLLFYQQLAHYHRLKFKDLKVIAITGSCGKTSTKEIVASLVCDNLKSVLKTVGNTNNHIGVPQNLLRLRTHHKFAVLELGTNHFGEIKVLTELAKPDVAMITCIGGAHLEFFKDRDGVAREKSDIFCSMKSNSPAVIPIFELTRPAIVSATKELQLITFGELGSSADWQASEIDSDLTGSMISIKSSVNEVDVRWSLTGSHQATNCAGALALLDGLGIQLTNEEISKRLQRVKLPGLRGNISQIDGVTWINDAYNANSESTISTLAWLKSVKEKVNGRIFIVLGDMLELGETARDEHQSVLQFLSENRFYDQLYLIGPQYQNVSKICPGSYCFGQSADAQSTILVSLRVGDTIFLKGSRGIKLELIVPVSL